MTFAAAGRRVPEVNGGGKERPAGGGDGTSSAEGERGANDLDLGRDLDIDFDLRHPGAAGQQTWLSQEVADLATHPGAPAIGSGTGGLERRRRWWAWRLLAIKEIFHTQL